MSLRARSLALTTLLLPAALLLGCAGGADPHETQEEDILAAVQIYLREQRGMNPEGMGMQLTHLAVDGDHAQATIQFSSQDGGRSFDVQYALSHGSDGWTVSGSAGQGGHGDMPGGPGNLPPNHPPLPEDAPPDPNAGTPPETS